MQTVISKVNDTFLDLHWYMPTEVVSYSVKARVIEKMPQVVSISGHELGECTTLCGSNGGGLLGRGVVSGCVLSDPIMTINLLSVDGISQEA